MEIIYLCFFAFLAGFIDSVVGGGGLIQLPALLVIMPNTPVPVLLGTGKLVSISGTASSLLRYSRDVRINWKSLLPAAVTAFVFSFLGARAISHLPVEALRPMVLFLLIAVAFYTFWKKDLGSLHAPRLSVTKERWYAILAGMAIGFYDGFFGPGTGSFLIFVFIGIFGFSFVAASASAKVVNLATNLSALGYFVWKGYVLYQIALPMAACNIVGSVVGTQVALKQGSGFVRRLFLVVVTAIILKFAYDTFQKGRF
ncbi:TSUP family transporter [Adhaeribacter sp. BT258]|uniref:Probable membrane transporter protein n=1 Tax=Adhaeribacter terrigena TaxID=2793070 RepID=A0ABS1BWN8_9BACT|nr:TSUP family transporter [Adhaeribacter terrigena]MBK0401545.1 TSUP family transporter [Adhaeribacter terrigena]